MDEAKTPCRNCEERELGCHSHCIVYRKYRSELEKQNKEAGQKRGQYYGEIGQRNRSMRRWLGS